MEEDRSPETLAPRDTGAEEALEINRQSPPVSTGDLPASMGWVLGTCTAGILLIGGVMGILRAVDQGEMRNDLWLLTCFALAAAAYLIGKIQGETQETRRWYEHLGLTANRQKPTDETDEPPGS